MIVIYVEIHPDICLKRLSKTTEIFRKTVQLPVGLKPLPIPILDREVWHLL